MFELSSSSFPLPDLLDVSIDKIIFFTVFVVDVVSKVNSLFLLEDDVDDVPRDDEEEDGGADVPRVPFQKGRIVGPKSGGWWTLAVEAGSLSCTRRHTDSESKVSKVLVRPRLPPSLPSGPVLLVTVLCLLPSQPPAQFISL